MLRDFFLGSIKVHILYHASKGPVFGLALIEELGHHGYQLGPGTLYPILHALEEAQYLQSERQVVNGRVRRYYRITPKGQQALEEARPKIRQLMDEIIGE